MVNRYQQYLQALNKPFKKLAKIEFLQPDNSVAFMLDNNYKRGFRTRYDTRAFIQSGSLSVSLQNGQRRRASITLSNLDGAYDYAINKIWFGQRIRLLMGLELPDGMEFYLSQGVFYISNPSSVFKPNQRTVTYNLVDKWAYLDGTLFGTLDGTYSIDIDLNNGSLWGAMSSVLALDRKTFTNNNVEIPIDNVKPVFTTFYNDKTGNEVQANIPYGIVVSGDSSNLANILLELNNVVVGWIGYDQTGALRVDASQNDIYDNLKPVLWEFTPKNSQLLGISETFKNSEVYNEVIVIGQSVAGSEIYGKVTNTDPRSDTNVNIIGRRTYKESQPNYSKVQQCVDLAQFRLKRKTVLQKSITIESSQMFHLVENNLVTVVRTDKEGSPIEKHLINSFTLPIGETGQMSINCTSVNDLPDLTIENAPPPSELQLLAPRISISGDTLQITDTSGLATSFDILVDGVVMASVENEVEEETYTLSGTWIFSEDIQGSTKNSFDIKFTSEGVDFNAIYFWYDDKVQFRNVSTNEFITVYTYERGWLILENNVTYRTITFDGTQTVSKEFYDWFTANAKPAYTVTVTLQNDSGETSFKGFEIYDRYSVDENGNYICSGNLIGSITSSRGSTTVQTTTGKLCCKGYGEDYPYPIEGTNISGNIQYASSNGGEREYDYFTEAFDVLSDGLIEFVGIDWNG